jgi:pyruvate/2-oxoacid:ferredoxin oxidoreductase beta subunit
MTSVIEEKDLTIQDHPVSDFIRTDRLPWIFCQGCLIGSEIQLLARSMKNLVEKGEIERDNILMASGIGCSGRGSGYFQTDSFHTTHGRSVLSTNSTPWGNFAEIPFNLVYMAAAAGATYVARWTALHTKEAIESMEKAIMHPGFSFIEFITPCPTYFGKFTDKRTGLLMMRQLQDAAVVKNGSNPFEAEMDYEGQIICGEFATKERPEYIEQYEKLREKALGKKAKYEKKGKEMVYGKVKGTCEEGTGD